MNVDGSHHQDDGPAETADPSIVTNDLAAAGHVEVEAIDGGSPKSEPAGVDLARIADELADVEVALARLDNGSYWSDEVTGAELPDELLAASPIARRLPTTGG